MLLRPVLCGELGGSEGLAAVEAPRPPSQGAWTDARASVVNVKYTRHVLLARRNSALLFVFEYALITCPFTYYCHMEQQPGLPQVRLGPLHEGQRRPPGQRG